MLNQNFIIMQTNQKAKVVIGHDVRVTTYTKDLFCVDIDGELYSAKSCDELMEQLYLRGFNGGALVAKALYEYFCFC